LEIYFSKGQKILNFLKPFKHRFIIRLDLIKKEKCCEYLTGT